MMLFAGERVSIPIENVKAFNSLRVQLHKQHQTMWALDMTAESMCSHYDPVTEIGSFWLGKSRAAKRKDWTILTDDQGDGQN